MPKVELIYDADCPNVAAAREALMRGFAAAGVTPRWSEHLSAEGPAYARGLGSPTVLVDEQDVSAGSEPSPESCCRLYETDDRRLVGVPEVDTIARALAEAVARPAPGISEAPPSWRSSLGALPAVGAALLPKVACPAGVRRRAERVRADLPHGDALAAPADGELPRPRGGHARVSRAPSAGLRPVWARSHRCWPRDGRQVRVRQRLRHVRRRRAPRRRVALERLATTTRGFLRRL